METNINEMHNSPITSWKVAKKKAAFRFYLFIYVIVNCFLWTIWYINTANNINPGGTEKFPWPLWPMLFWGVGLLFNYFEVYKSKNSSAKKEYQNLKNNQ
ncbi:MAG: 2TM domain-containing protein [Ginsengibacter sp.]